MRRTIPRSVHRTERGRSAACRTMSPSVPPPFVHDVQGIEFKVVTLIKPGADKVIEPQARTPGEREGIDHELGDRLFSDGVWFVVENMDPAVPDLHEVDMTSESGLGRERNGKAEFLLHMGDVLWREVDRHFNGHGYGISREHEALKRVMPTCVVGHGL